MTKADHRPDGRSAPSCSAPLIAVPVFIRPWLWTTPTCPYTVVAFDRKYLNPIAVSTERLPVSLPSLVSQAPASASTAGVNK